MSSETESLKIRIDAALASGRLSAWQRSFLSDMRSRLELYGSRARLSDKQRQKLVEIVGDGTAAVRFAAPVPKAVYERPRRRWPSSRKGPRWPRLYFRDYLLLGVLVVLLLAKLSQSFAPNLPDTGHSSNVLSVTSGDYEADYFPSQHFTVTDGDTIRVSGELTGTRLVGFNTPETFSPRCPHEAELGSRATARLKQIVATSSVQLTKVACSCAPGTEGTDRCNYGRSCGILRADGKDVGDILIAEGLAVPFACGAGGCPPTPRPWCG